MLALSELENILDFYKCPCDVLATRQGGGYVDYLLQPIKGTTINKVQARTKDFCLALGQPVSIAFENMTLIFRIKDGEQQIYNHFEYTCNLINKAGQIGFGINPRGEYVQYNLFDMPHLLVAGATGSGKSIFLHNAIIDLAQDPNVCFTLIDLKRVELSIYNGLNKVDGEAVTDALDAEKRLRFEVAEMENRYKIMERHHARHISQLQNGYKNRVIIIDELADLMLNRDTRKSVENSVVRIAQLGRAAGIHLILATQRPSTDVITGLIKANIPCRIAFKTASATDSRVIGCKGAEMLAGRGDALLLIAGHDELERVQGFYISDDDLQTFVDGVRQMQPRQPQTRRGFFRRLFG